MPLSLNKFLPRKIRQFIKKIIFLGNKYYCNVCNSHLRFFELENSIKVCPICGVSDRHRWAWFYFINSGVFKNNHDQFMLHIAPETEFYCRIKKILENTYITTDMYDMRNIMIKSDISRLPFYSNSFSIVYCSHVLEHVTDDLAALNEIYRVLKKNGKAVILVPVSTNEATFENSSITDPEARKKAFGQEDHLRLYGSDLIKRLESPGFEVSTLLPDDFMNETQISLMGINPFEKLFVCTKKT